ncbi:MAG TPA: uroporphyrinogen-III synthase [Longimicrobiales bacterium]|nr:uroporphyrinogen-III synthase [Longimicrobiales bacterium]
MTADALPLRGLSVAVTRPEDDADELADLLERAGAVPVLIPLTRILPPVDDAPLRRAVANAAAYGWIIFTSARAVRAFGAVAAPESPGRLRARIAAVGPATAAAVHALTGCAPDVVPDRSTGAGIVPALLERGPLRDVRVLWPRAETPRPELPAALLGAGAALDDPIAYRTLPDPAAARRLADLAAAGRIDVITFTAPSAVDSFADALDERDGPRCLIAVIGPATADAVRARGLEVHVEPEQPIISALVSALAGYYIHGSRRHQ